MERKTFIRLSAYTAVVLALPLAESCHRERSDDPLAQPLLFSHIGDIATIKDAGSAYRKMVRSEDDGEKLRRLLSAEAGTGDTVVIRNELDRRVTKDFRSGRIVTVSGWVMSLTEARQCALFSILNS